MHESASVPNDAPSSGARVAFAGKRVLLDGQIRSAAVLVEDGRITRICGLDQVPREYTQIECGDHVLLPGLVDPHVHLNDPGRSDWEGFATGTRAAAAGGFTTLIDMPLNCLPATTNVPRLLAKRRAAEGQCTVDWAPWGGVSTHNVADLSPLAGAGVRGFKCFLVPPGLQGFEQVDEAELREAAPTLARLGLPLLVHAELPAPIERSTAALAHADWRRYATYLASRPDAAEVEAVAMLLKLVREFGMRLHIVHLATSEALPLLHEARSLGLPVTVETCPHYLYFSAEEIADGSTLHKCAPPIRSRENREALWSALEEGLIDMIGTDHSPCPPELKCIEEGNFQRAWGGISGLALALPVMWTGMKARGIALERIGEWMAANPARLAGLERVKGRIAPGCDADLVLFDPEGETRVSADTLYCRHPISPYCGATLRGRVVATWLRGQQVYAGGHFSQMCSGREVPMETRG